MSNELFYERVGNGPRHLLFAHGWISSLRMWDDVCVRLDNAKCTQHRFDFRGCGRSDRPREGHDLEGYASDLRTMLARIDAPVTLIGHSMGGRLAQYVASERPANLERMILVAPGSARSSSPTEKHRALTYAAYGSRAKIATFQRGAMAGDIPVASMERIVEDALIAQSEHWFGWYDRGRSIDFSERLAQIEVPVLVIAGGRDPIAPASRVKREVADAIPGALFVLLRECGHNVPVEKPHDLVEAIERFA